MAGVTLLLILFSALSAILAKDKGGAGGAGRRDTSRPHWSAVLALQAGYVACMYLLGFTIATLLFFLAAPWQLGYRRVSIVALQAVILTAVISGAFSGLFQVRLPKGLISSLF